MSPTPASPHGYGVSSLAAQRVTSLKGAHLDNGFFAGSVLALNDAVVNYKRNNNLSMVDAIKPVTKNPAQMMGIYGTKAACSMAQTPILS